jgi:hypothetical protein
MKLASRERGKAKRSERILYTCCCCFFFLDITGKSFTKVYPLTHIFFQNKVEGDFADGTRGLGGESKIT